MGFENQINKCLELAEYLYAKIKTREEFEMVFDGEVGCQHGPHMCSQTTQEGSSRSSDDGHLSSHPKQNLNFSHAWPLLPKKSLLNPGVWIQNIDKARMNNYLKAILW